MIKLRNQFCFTVLFLALFWSCQESQPEPEIRTRAMRDTVGFAHTADQMDSILARINRTYGKERRDIFSFKDVNPETRWKLAISPHDDYAYAGDIYPYALRNLSAKTIIIFGVAHKAKLFGLENRLIFDTFPQWQAPYGPVPVSGLREDLIARLPENTYVIHDSMQTIEHSVEALIPFLQYYNPSVEIVSVLVPYMNFTTMRTLADTLSGAIKSSITERNWKWGKDYAFAISNDCVHYGDEDWGGKNYAPFGVDRQGFRDAKNYDMNIISECLIDIVDPQRIRRFIEYTVKKENFREYAWTWCGRYSVPFGLLTAYDLQQKLHNKYLSGTMLRYSTSITHPPIKVGDLEMGTTAPANLRHWVGYVAIGYQFF